MKQGNVFIQQQILKETLLDESKDKREKNSINNVYDALVALHLNGVKISKKNISEYIDKNLGGKPTKRTLENDHKGIYGKLISVFYRQDKEVLPANNLGDIAQLKADYNELRKRLKRANNRIEILQATIDKNFDEMSQCGEQFSINKFLTKGNSEDPKFKQGIIEAPSSDAIAINAFVKLYKYALQHWDASVESGMLIEPDLGSIILDNKEFIAISKYLN